MKKLQVVLLTSNKLRHIWVANTIYNTDKLELRGIVAEPKSKFYKDVVETSPVIKKHFDLNSLYEAYYLGEYKEFPDVETLFIKKGEINNPNTIEWVESKKPDMILLFGTGLLKKMWFEVFKDNIINMHLGLSPYYRGNGTNFWPYVNWEPHLVGATILVTDIGVDSGAILTHVLPEVEPWDLPYDINMKLIKKATLSLIDSSVRYFYKRRSILQKDIDVEGKVYKRKDLTDQAVLKFWENINKGIVDYLIIHFDNLRSQLKLVENGTFSN